MIAGEFSRGQHRGGGKVVHATARDRVRALQLYRNAMKLAQYRKRQSEPAEMLRQFAEAIILRQPKPGGCSRSPISTSCPTTKKAGTTAANSKARRLMPHGNPIFYAVPKSWDAAKSDGERWRWLLETMVEWQPSRRNDERTRSGPLPRIAIRRANDGSVRLRLPESKATDADKKGDKTGIWALDTLGEDETIARLATGIKRFKLPDEHNFIKLYQQMLATTKAKRNRTASASMRPATLAMLFENRRQYPRAAEYWRQAIERTTGDARTDQSSSGSIKSSATGASSKA